VVFGLAGCLGTAIALIAIGLLAGADPVAAADASQPGSDSDEPPAGVLRPPTLDRQSYDKRNGQDILETCAACHGKEAEGGSDGTYPRLAGLPAEYIAAQIRDFKTRRRVNIPMFPYATERELPEDDVRDIALYLSGIELLTQMPELPDDTSAYQRLLMSRRVFNVPRVAGDVAKGERTYKKTCRRCHGTDGWGRGTTPQLAGQHTEYLRHQIARFKAGERTANEEMMDAITPLSLEDIENLFAYLASRDD
jgi:cytochrome c553